jgi:endogenous inhibitor of DNA gyrase (YacG/DUF329 family)
VASLPTFRGMRSRGCRLEGLNRQKVRAVRTRISSKPGSADTGDLPRRRRRARLRTRASGATARQTRLRARAVERMDSGSRRTPDEGHTPTAQAVSGSVRTKLGGRRMSLEKGSVGRGDNGCRAPVERGLAGRGAGSSGVCPRCGSPVPVRATGRPARWCSQRCRRAAYEERRAADAGAIAVEVVETVTTTEHGLDECVRRVQASPVAMRKVLTHLTKLLAEDGLRDPKWASTVDSAVILARAVGTGGRSSARFPPRGYVKPGW